ncbi:MAG: hypothetical protein PF518_08920, partial [Spirochaetaceae bacterium]|nr:hypothetical protein [Spirochaetaceae bacterium]
MIDFLAKIKKNISLLLAVYHVVISVLAAAFLFYVMRSSLIHYILFAELILLIFSVLFYKIGKYFTIKNLIYTTSSLEAISKSILKNTRMVINNISHEIRTPLNAIMGFTDSLYENEEDQIKKESLYAIKNNSDRLFSITKKLIDFSSIETGEFPIERQYFSVHSLLVNLENKYKESLLHESLQLNIINQIPKNY